MSGEDSFTVFLNKKVFTDYYKIKNNKFSTFTLFLNTTAHPFANEINRLVQY